MKSRSFILSICAGMLCLCSACEEALPLFETEQDRLNFTVEDKKEVPTVLRKTFVYDPEDMLRDTIYVTVNGMGYVRDYDRMIRLEQMEVKPDSVYNAVPGVHYVAFDDPEMEGLFVLRAGKVAAKLPIITLRDPSLRDTVCILRLRIVESEYFKPGDQQRIEQTVEIGDQLMQPKNWMCVGAYGQVKHRFLIKIFPGFRFDEETFDLFYIDYQFGNFVNGKARNALAQENAERKARGEGPLCEANGKPVFFPG